MGEILVVIKTARPLGRGQDAESNLLNPHSFRNLSAYSWKIPLTVFIIPKHFPAFPHLREREKCPRPNFGLDQNLDALSCGHRQDIPPFCNTSASDGDRMPKWHNLLPNLVRAPVDVRHKDIDSLKWNKFSKINYESTKTWLVNLLIWKWFKFMVHTSLYNWAKMMDKISMALWWRSIFGKKKKINKLYNYLLT